MALAAGLCSQDMDHLSSRPAQATQQDPVSKEKKTPYEKPAPYKKLQQEDESPCQRCLRIQMLGSAKTSNPGTQGGCRGRSQAGSVHDLFCVWPFVCLGPGPCHHCDSAESVFRAPQPPGFLGTQPVQRL